MEGMEKFYAKLAEKKETILAKWYQLMLEDYSKETVVHMAKGKNQFQNPMGHNFYQGLEGILAFLIDEDSKDLEKSLDKILRIRAVQDIPPSKGLDFIFLLKKVVQEELASLGFEEGEYRSFYQKVDKVALLAVDIYVSCRERLYQIRLDEANKRYQILERFNK